MTRNMRFRHIDVTTRKSNKIEFLERQVNNASTIVAEAQSKYNSFVEKANTFAELYAEAQADQQKAEGFWKLFLQVKSDVEGLNQTSDEANLVAVDAFHDVKQLIREWEDVTAQTIKAAEAIVLTADFIQKRKASNPLISNDLVADAVSAANNAQKVVSTVIKAFTDALSTLSSSTQANNSTELTDVYVNLTMSFLLKSKSQDLLPLVLAKVKDGSISETQKENILELATKDEVLEELLYNALQDADTKTELAMNASESANREMNIAKEELAQATASLSTWEAALNAAETAVAG